MIVECEAGTDWGYDTEQPWDGHWSEDNGATWADPGIRPYIRAVYSGETPGDVPISGIVNNIPIPNVSSKSIKENIDVPIDELTLINVIEGAGYVDLVVMRTAAMASSHLTAFIFYADGVECWRGSPTDLNNWGFIPQTQPLSLLQFAEDGINTIMNTKRWEFRRRFWIYAQNLWGAQRVYVRAYPNLMG